MAAEDSCRDIEATAYLALGTTVHILRKIMRESSPRMIHVVQRFLGYRPEMKQERRSQGSDERSG